jgi:hypothetical protein
MRDPRDEVPEVSSPEEAPALNCKPIMWLKGHLRDENRASACRHRNINALVAVEEQHIKVPSPIKGLNGQPQMQEAVTLTMSPFQPMQPTCSSPGLIEHATQQLSPEIRGQLQKLMVTLEVCRACPYWEPETKQ